MTTASESACPRNRAAQCFQGGGARAEANSLYPTNNNRFGADCRLSEERLIRRTIKSGSRYDNAYFQYFRLALTDGPTRFCITVPRRVGNAPTRNRVKRQIREFLRTQKRLWPESTALIIKVKPSAATAENREIAAALNSYLQT